MPSGGYSIENLLLILISTTYFVIQQLHLAILVSLILFMIGIGYWIFYKTNTPLSVSLIQVHLVATFIIPIFALITSIFYREFIPGQNFQKMIKDSAFNETIVLIITILILISVIGQIVYPINLSIGIIKKRKTSS